LGADQSDYIREALSISDIHKYENLVLQVALAKRQIYGEDVDAISLLNTNLMKDFDVDIFNLLFRTYIETEKTDEAETLFNKYKTYLLEPRKFECNRALLEGKGLFVEALTMLEQRKSVDYIEDSTHMYLLIKCEKFDQAKALGKGVLEPINYSTEDPVLIVNYELARKNLGESPSDKRLNEVISQHSDNESFKSACYAILNKKQDMLNSIKKGLKKDKTFKYELSVWPVFDQYRNDEDFKQLV
jgi:hypothetical protein